MNLVEKFKYKTLEKVTYASGARHYLCPETGNKLPSVTTILDKTAGEKKELLEWKIRVGEKEANRIKNEALALGTLMHTHLEKYIIGEPRPGGNNTARLMAERMADQIIERGLVNVDAVFGSEVHLYIAQLMAGTCDAVGEWRGKPAILDFKTAKKIRTREMIDDYFAQIAAYGLCHNELYETNINVGVIFMVDREYNFQEFVIEGDEFQEYQMKFLDRLEQFRAM
jgi:hypothetical protein